MTSTQNNWFENGREAAFGRIGSADLYDPAGRIFLVGDLTSSRRWQSVGAMPRYVMSSPGEIGFPDSEVGRELMLEGAIDAVAEFAVAAALVPDERSFLDRGKPLFLWEIMPERYSVPAPVEGGVHHG